ncbi:MAG: septal ring lytic transglycosylase RlpA family protein [Cyanobacteria bacterium J06638_22]
MNLVGFVWLISLTSSGWLGELLPPMGNLMTKLGLDNAALSQRSVNAFALLDSDCIWLRSAGCTAWNPLQSVAMSKEFEALSPTSQSTAPLPSESGISSEPGISAIIINPLDKLYTRLVPWLRGDRPRGATSPVTLSQADAVPTSVMAETTLFHLCDIHDGTDRAIAYQTQAPYQVWVNGQQVLSLPSQEEAEALVRALRLQLQRTDFDANQFYPRMIEGRPGVVLEDEVLLTVDESLVLAFQRNADLIAMEWANNLRRALGGPSFSLADAQAYLYDLQPSEETLDGIASWYGPYFHKRLTANGERFNQYEFTAAHQTLEFGTQLRVTNLDNGHSVIVRINDRGPYVGDRSLDLSYQAALCIDSDESGLVDYEAVILQPDESPIPVDLPIEDGATASTSDLQPLPPLASIASPDAVDRVD